ncbi:MAG: hypothetical protein DWH81_00630 [Planctomycetota bacterium]|nr:MAG: hypothetical protein DWH81_00630 [Planctomycetota bacterium]
MSRLALTITRFASAAWVGAAVLFVINGVQQTTSGKFESMTTDQLVLLRFPAYYLMGFILVGLSLLGAVLSGTERSQRQRRMLIVLFGLSLVIMLFDYLVVYLPLAEMITPPGKARPQGFQTLHKWSMRVNSIDLLLVMIGSLTACWPRRGVQDAR